MDNTGICFDTKPHVDVSKAISLVIDCDLTAHDCYHVPFLFNVPCITSKNLSSKPQQVHILINNTNQKDWEQQGRSLQTASKGTNRRPYLPMKVVDGWA